MRMVEDRGAAGSVAGLLGKSAEHDLVIASFSRFLGARGCSPNTVSAYLHDLKFLFAFLLSAGLTIEQLNVARSIDFMAYLTARPRRVGGRQASTPAIVSDRLAPATINRVMAAVSTFYEHLVLTRALSLERNPLDGGGNEQHSTRRTNRRSMRLRRVLRVPRPMDNEQVSRLLGAATRLRDRTMLLLLLQGGIRVGELLNLHLEDVQYGRRRIAIRYRVDHPAACGQSRDVSASLIFLSLRLWRHSATTWLQNGRTMLQPNTCSSSADVGADAASHSAMTHSSSYSAVCAARLGWTRVGLRHTPCATPTRPCCGKEECVNLRFKSVSGMRPWRPHGFILGSRMPGCWQTTGER